MGLEHRGCAHPVWLSNCCRLVWLETVGSPVGSVINFVQFFLLLLLGTVVYHRIHRASVATFDGFFVVGRKVVDRPTHI